MSNRLEILFTTADDIAHAIINNRTPMSPKIIDPNLELEVCWPDSFIKYREEVKQREKSFGRDPLTNLQWIGVEKYLESQYGLILPEDEKTVVGVCYD